MDEGLMGPLPTHLQAKDLAGLKKLNPMMANQLEAFSQSTRTLQFPTGTN